MNNLKLIDLISELNDLVQHYQEITTSDLQGVCGALSKKYGMKDEVLLQYIVDKIKEQSGVDIL